MPAGSSADNARRIAARKRYLAAQEAARKRAAAAAKRKPVPPPLRSERALPATPQPKTQRASVSPDINGPHRGTGRVKPAQAKKPTYSTKRGPGADKALTKTRRHAALEHAAARLERAGLHKEAKQLRSGVAPSRDFGERLGKDVKDFAFGLPGGIFHIGKAATQDVSDIAHGRVGRRQHHKPFRHLGGIAEDIGRQYAHDYRHPIRHFQQHPGFVGMDVFAALSAGAGAATRVGAAGRAAAETGSVRAALSRPASEGGSLLKRPLPEPRTQYYEGHPVAGRYSQNPGAALIQKANQRRTGGKIGVEQYRRRLDEQRRVTDAAERSTALRILGKDRKMRHVNAHGKRVLTKEGVAKNLAVDVVGVGLPIDEHVRLLRQAAARAEGRERQQLSRRAELIDKEARKHLDESSGKPRLIDSDLEAIVRHGIAKNEDETIAAGLLSRGGAEARTHGAGRVLLGAKFEPRSLAELGGADFHLIGKRVRTRDGMKGAVVDVSGDEASVRLWSKGNPVVDIPLEQLYPSSGKVRSGRLVGGGRAIMRERQATLEEAKADLAALDERIKNLTAPIIEREYQEHIDSYKFEHESRRAKPATGREAQDIIRRPHGGQIDIQRTGETAIPVERDFKYQKPASSARGIAEERFWNSVYRSTDAPAMRLKALVKEHSLLQDAINAHEAEGFMRRGASPLTELYVERHGNIVDVDDVRDLIPAYAKAGPDEKAALAGKYHAQAKKGADRIYDELLDEPPKTGKVALMGGGSGAGKSTVRVPASKYDVVLDTTLAGETNAIAKVEKALNSGRSVEVFYVYRDPAEAYVNGVLNAGRLEAHGRVVPLAEHVRMHQQSNATIRALEKRYASDERVTIRVYENGPNGTQVIPLDELPSLKYDEVEKEVRRAYEAKAAGLSEAQREAALRPGRGGAREVGGRVEQAHHRGGERSGGPVPGAAEPELDVPILGTREEAVSSVPYTGGEFYTPERLLSTKRRKPGSGPQAYQGGIPRKPGSKTNPYTGALRRAGENTHEVLRAIAEHILADRRYLSVDRLRESVLPVGRKARPMDEPRSLRNPHGVKWVPVSERPLTRAEAMELERSLEFMRDAQQLTPEQASLLDDAVKGFTERLFPQERYRNAVPGDEIEGVRWVDSRLISSQHKLIGSLGPVDVVQDAVKGLILYGKPGYVTPNVLGNAGMNLIQQGFLAPRNWKRAMTMDNELKFMVDEVMGAGFSRGLAEGTTSVLSGAVHKAGNFWGKIVDGPFRRAAFVHEAYRKGFRSDEAMRALIEDPKYRGELAETGQRARDAIVDYERMGPAERDVIRRVIFVYPWIKGSTYYFAQFLRDHPIQAAVFAGIARYGNAQNARDLGPVPAWAQGSFKVFEHNGTPFVVNPSAITPFSTPANVIAAAQGGFGSVERSENVGEMVSPVLQAAIEAGFAQDLFTHEELKGGYFENFGRQLGKGLPQYNLYRRLTTEPKEGASYPYGPYSAIGQFVLGSSSPRPVNVETLNEQAQKPLDSRGRAIATVNKEARELHDLFAKTEPDELDGGKLPKGLRRAFRRKSAVEVARAQIEHQYPHQTDEDKEARTRAKFDAEVDILAKWGVMDAKEAKAAKAWQKRHSADDVADARRYFTDHYFDDAYLGLIRDSRKYLEDKVPTAP